MADSAPVLELARNPGVRIDSRTTVALASLDAALLAWLALEGPTPRARITALLWPDKDIEAARNSLRQRLFKLRKQLGVELIAGSTTLALARCVQHDLDDADNVLGDINIEIEGEFVTWLEQQRSRRRARMRQSLAELSDMAEGAREWSDALTHANELLSLEPLSEDAHRRVMRLHYLAGDRAAALLAFDRCELVLKDEVGAKPSSETMALLRTVEESGVSTDSDPQNSKLPARVPVAVARPPLLIGRGNDLAAALRAWRAGKLFCLEGEAGLGKTRLLQEIAVRRTALFVSARAGDQVVPYATLSRLLRTMAAHPAMPRELSINRSLAPLLPEFGTSGGAVLALRPATAQWIDAASRVGIDALIVDDLHFADDASLEMLLELTRGRGAVSTTWGFARRPAEGSAALTALIDGLLEEQRIEPLPLAPLTREQLTELMASLGIAHLQAAELAVSLHQHSGGNPLFALETLRQAWVETGLRGVVLPRPVSVTRVIERRLSGLSPAAIRLARCAAVAGADFSIQLAAVVLAVPAIDLADAWSELERAHVFADDTFAHDLIHEAVRGGLPRPIACHLHGEVACHLEQHGAPPASIAEHFLAAGQTARALPFLHLAGQAAAAQRRFGEAAASYEREARLRLQSNDQAGAYLAAQGMRRAAFELDLAHRTDDALDLLDQSASTAQQRAFACAERAIVCMHRGAMVDAERAVTHGMAALGDLPDPGLRALLLQHLAAVRVWEQRAADAYEILRSIEHAVQATGEVKRQFEFAQGFAVVLEHLERPSESVRWQRRAADLALQDGNVPSAAQSLLNLALGYRDSGRLEAALATMHEAQRLLSSLPEGAIPYSSLDLNFGIVMRDLGRLGESIEWLDRAIERGQVHTPGWVPLIRAHRAHTWLLLGQFARAQQDLVAASISEAPPYARTRRDLVQAMLLRMLGRDCAPILEHADAAMGAGARPLLRHRLTLARCPTMAPAEALAAAGAVLEEATAAQRHGLIVGARMRLCQAAMALGHHSEAARHARQIATLDADTGSDDLYRGEVWLTAIQALTYVDPPKAIELTHNAAQWLREIAAKHVEPSFRESFLSRNPVNRDLLALRSRLNG